MQVNVVGHVTLGETQQLLLQKLCFKVFCAPSFPAKASRKQVDFSLARASEDVDAYSVNDAKFLLNPRIRGFLAFRNKADELIKSLGLNNSEVARLGCTGARMSKHNTSKYFKSHAGKCCLTRMDWLIDAFHRNGLNPMLFEVIRACNLGIEKWHAST